MPLVLPIPSAPFNPSDPKSVIEWSNYWLSLSNISQVGAPGDAQYLVATANTVLTNDRNLGLLATGFLFVTVAAGIAVPSSTLSGALLTALNASNLASGTVPDARFPATLPALNGSALTSLTGANIVGGGVYTPTLTNVTNLGASTAFQCQYCRVGAVVTVSGKVSVDPTGAGATELGISLPIASNFGAAEDCGGVAFASGITGQGAAIYGDVTNDRASMQWVAVDVTNQPMGFTFSYRVI